MILYLYCIIINVNNQGVYRKKWTIILKTQRLISAVHFYADGSFEGIAHSRYLRLSQSGDTVTLHNIKEEDIPLWEDYFDLLTDYGAIITKLSADKTLALACKSSNGIRILKQDPFETLISFIISQNNNIPRISGIIGRLCEGFGSKIEGGYAFPTLKQLEGVTVDDLAPLRAGFRAKYICDAVRKVSSGEVDFREIDALPLAEAREKLKLICGVGDKVANCICLFAYGRTNMAPIDTWILKIINKEYNGMNPFPFYGETAGIMQQYAFYYAQSHKGELTHGSNNNTGRNDT